MSILEEVDRRLAQEEESARKFGRPVKGNGAVPPGSGSAGTAVSVDAFLETVCAFDVAPQPIRWLWPGRIARSKLTVIAGDPGLGKSLVSIALATHVSLGAPWPVDRAPCPQGTVLLISAEDDVADTIRPRLDAAGADVGKVHILKTVRETDPETGRLTARSLSLKNDISLLEATLGRLADCRLVVIDPVSAYLDGTDSHKNADVRALLTPLAEMATRHQAAFVAITHLNKGSGQSAMYRTTGSLAFVAAARAVFAVTKDKDNDARRLVLPVKNNLGIDNTGIAYRISVADNDAPYIQWENEPVTVTADEALAPAIPDDARTERDEAAEWLQETLKDGPVLTTELQKQAKQAGLSWRTVRRAKEALGIQSEKDEFSGKWRWRLPEGGHEGGHEGGQSKKGGHLRESWPSSTESTTYNGVFRPKNVIDCEGGQGGQRGEGGHLREDTPPADDREVFKL